MAIKLKSAHDIEKMRAAGRVVRQVLEECRKCCQPGVTTRQIDEVGLATIERLGAKGLFKNYPTYKPGEGFPGNLCISVNEEVVHGIPGDRVIKEGDAVGIDCGVRVDGWCGDAAITVMVGAVRPEVRKLCETTQKALELAIANIRPGRKWSQMARLIENTARDAGLSVVEQYVGHGIGQQMHEDPKVPNFVSRDDLLHGDVVLREGMVLAIEPMFNLGVKEVVSLEDGWTVVTRDGKASAHYEHTVAVTAEGASVLTDGK